MRPAPAAEPCLRVRRLPLNAFLFPDALRPRIVGMELRQRALRVLCLADPEQKSLHARELHEVAASLLIADAAPTVVLGAIPGRPERPELIHPAKVARRSPFKPEGLAALLHAIA